VLVKLDGRWYTPPLAAGALPGVMRTVLLQDPGWGLSERNISCAELRRAEQLALCNALRGVLMADIEGPI
jgi:para-aminobenzoate synthetase/4-amino-4-deoxychorismate lyase